MFSSKELIIRLELNGDVLQEVSSADIKEEISIGRNPGSTWVIPPTDKSASNNHAKLFVKGGHAIIKDMQSRNGTFFQGERITERKLQAGDQIRIGDCLLKRSGLPAGVGSDVETYRRADAGRARHRAARISSWFGIG